jgi:glutamyl-tRNA reductase
MELAVLGANHETAGITLRERLVLQGPTLDGFYADMAQGEGLTGLVVLSTCNRTEIYWSGSVGVDTVQAVWAHQVGVDPEEFQDDLYLHAGDRAARHLFRVAAGLDSMMLGETEILGQVKAAYQTAQERSRVGSLHRLFLAAIRVGKRAHRETAIGQHALSMGYAAVELARKVYGQDLQPLQALIIGAGEMGSLAARHFRSAGVGRMMVANRTRERAFALARDLEAEVVEWGVFADALTRADLVVTSTSAPAPVIRAEAVRQAVQARRGRPLMLLDLAVPRDIEPGVEDLSPTVFRYDVDDLEHVVAENRRRREREIAQVDHIVDEELEAFRRGLAVQAVGPIIRSLREKAEGIRRQELEAAWHKLPHLSAEDRAVVERTTRQILNKLLNDPMVSIRGWAGQPEAAVYLDALRDLFRLEDQAEPVTDHD